MADPQTAAAELRSHPFRQLGVWRIDVFQLVGRSQFVPLVTAHLMKTQDLNTLDGFQSCDNLRDSSLVRSVELSLVINPSRPFRQSRP
ncbi:hypothetical protein CI15_25260 [Paraburkholderia monticola]|uniref:Uncharacterized protein n=1 Tax=Paraburkholderia monticola TaxID=1399968 RepID=A0A149PFQ7_9BURK|nr:hypothetical protein [Paraburkholderia monticola]KXU83848.1 hypothetical protein CI15_25260 [Paraburkholderia monticola]